VKSAARICARIAALALGCALPFFTLSAPMTFSASRTVREAPDLVARGLTGENVRVSKHRGEVVVVSFWSGSCNTCRNQLEALDRIAKTYASAGLTVIGVNLDANLARAEKFARSQTVQFPLLIAAPETIGRDYHIDRVPMTVFVDRSACCVPPFANSNRTTKISMCASCAPY
jgi:peroxiredoxin